LLGLHRLAFKERKMAYPQNYRYTQQHEWIRMDGDVATVGITDYAQRELGDVVFVELPKNGAKVTAGKSFGTVESVKAVSEIYAPVSGEVVETNGTLQKTPEKINSDPHGDAWLIKVRVANSAEVNSLMDAAAYEKFIAEKGQEATA
jgi:glycine cleavage system H protein